MRPSLYQWLRGFIVGLVLSISNLALVTVVGIIVGDAIPVRIAVVGSLALVLLVLAIFSVGATLAHRAEMREGYLTIQAGFINVATVNPRTGEVIRQPGDPLLSPQGFRDAVRRMPRGGPHGA